MGDSHKQKLGAIEATENGVKGVCFSVYSEHATHMDLCLKAQDNPQTRIPMTKNEDNIWSVFVADIQNEQLYGFHADGPFDPGNGHRFDKTKLLLDPYAKGVLPTQNDQGETIIWSRVQNDDYNWEDDKRPSIPWSDTIFYEMHAKGFTKTHPSVDTADQGYLKALQNPACINHLKDIGVTSIELLPIHAFLHEGHLKDKNLKNYWGYNSIGFFAPQPDYLKTGVADEFKDTVKALHSNGIEVILDVVYNHTAEGNERGETLSFKGIDNKTYYGLIPGQNEYYKNDSGCGNTINASNPAVVRMIIDSLRYWVEEYHIDGFRFDLATVLGRNPDKYDRDAPLFKAIAADPVLSKVKMIAEPWDIHTYELGGFPKGWAEWNDKYRDTVRKFWRGDHQMAPEMARRITASSNQFDHSGRSPLDSINFIAAHDGFSLHDLVTYNQKHNDANQEGNRDGHSNDHSCNYGHEGETENLNINAIRQQQKRNMLASLFLSRGTPMLLSGDEFGNTQHGNNNAYCQDNDIGWLNWDQRTGADFALTAFTQKIIDIRKNNPAITAPKFLHGKDKDVYGVKNITWVATDGSENAFDDAHAKCFGVVYNNAALKTTRKKNSRLLVIFNAAANDVPFTLPTLKGGKSWTKTADTSGPLQQEETEHRGDTPYIIPARSTVVFSQNLP